MVHQTKCTSKNNFSCSIEGAKRLKPGKATTKERFKSGQMIMKQQKLILVKYVKYVFLSTRGSSILLVIESNTIFHEHEFLRHPNSFQSIHGLRATWTINVLHLSKY